jgi:CHAT domain-containing protein/predicted negative regulator of RcsB-dependent stress response
MDCPQSRLVCSLPSILQFCLLTISLFSAQIVLAQTSSNAPAGKGSSTAVMAQTVDSQQLRTAGSTTREIKGGEAHHYLLIMRKGEFLRAVAKSQGINISATLFGPDEAQLLSMDLIRAPGPEPISFEAEKEGQYRLVVRGEGPAASSGKYELTSELKRSATAPDRERMAAERLLVEAAKLQREGSKESLESAGEKNLTAAEHLHRIGDKFWEGYALHTGGTVSYFLGDRKKALDYWNQAVTLRRSAGDRSGEAGTLGNLSAAYSELGEKQKALELNNLALPIFREVGNRTGEANTLNNIGNVYSDLGEKQKALEFYNQALQLRRAMGDRNSEGIALNNIGNLYSMLGDKKKAVEIYIQTLEIRRALGDRQGEAITLTNLSATYSDLGEKQKALEYYNLSLPILRAIGDRAVEAVTLNNMGNVYYDLGDRRKALEFYNQALPTLRTVGDRSGEADTLVGIGNTYAALGDKQKALEYYNKALPIKKAVGDPAGEAQALVRLMLLWRELEKPSLAIFYGKQAVNSYQQLRSNIQGLDRDLQKKYLKTVEDVYRQLSDLLIANRRLPEAQQVLAMLKEEEYFGFVRGDGAGSNALTVRASLSPEESTLEAEYNKLADEVTLLGKQRGDLFVKKDRTDHEEKQLTRLEDQLAVASDHFQKFLEDLQVKLGVTTAQGARVNEIRDALGMQKTLRELGDGAVLLYTLVGEDRYRVMLVTPDAQQAYEHPIKAVDLQRKVLAFREALQDRRSDPAPLARELYGILIGTKLGQDLKQAGAKTLMWSLDGVLRYLPVAALQDEEKKYLIESYRSVVFTPASRDRLKDPVAQHWKGLGLGVSKGGEVMLPEVNRRVTFNALPGVPQELRSIFRDPKVVQTPATGEGVLEGKVMLDEGFTKDALRTALRQQYALVHIASHFRFQPGNENDSFLLLGGTDDQNNRLTLGELKHISLEGVNLLTLSACETALGGEKANGVEVESFGVLAQRQGAGAVLATLWPVADASTPLLMKEFYQLREKSPGMTKSEALTRAQLALLKGAIKSNPNGGSNRGLEIADDTKPATSDTKPPVITFAHPFYWAPFILIGNWK